MGYVWQVTADGAEDPSAVRAAVGAAVDRLTGGQHDGVALDPDELRVWTEDVDFAVVSEPAHDPAARRTSVLVDVELHDRGAVAAERAAVLSGGFDTAVLDAVLAVPGVTGCGHTDRIARPE
jgi:hypothetical protein